MCTYLRNMANYKHNTEVVEGSRSQAEGSKKKTRAVLDKESVKRQKLEDDAEKEELNACLEVVPKDDEAVNIASLATKYPIVMTADDQAEEGPTNFALMAYTSSGSSSSDSEVSTRSKACLKSYKAGLESVEARTQNVYKKKMHCF
ncbi:hypothetical protein Tco_1110287 [Tanacetum coccineum]|uniref:Uncharacterized protein n=1 Tax=Tanacetum coccineum TaxID=301880 RepID=A0ABQ5IIE8_9ASTR